MRSRILARLKQTLFSQRDLPDVSCAPDDIIESDSEATLCGDQLTRVRASVTAEHPEDLAKPRNYRIGEKIGGGGMGDILQTRDLNVRRDVAMKVPRRDKAFSENSVRRFIQEAQVTGQLEHPGIVPVHEVGINDEGKPFYTMKFVKGVNLHEVLCGIRDGKEELIAKYSLAHLLTIFQKVCDAVAFAHSKGVVHRDLKPENIMIGEYGEVLVMDWGLAKILRSMNKEEQADEDRTGTADSEMASVISGMAGATMEGQLLGTLQFMAPEQARGKVSEIDPRTDIYALGGILYNILTLHAPVTGESKSEILERIRNGQILAPSVFSRRSSWRRKGMVKLGTTRIPRPPVFPLRHCPSGRIPTSLSVVTMKALAPEKRDRYQTVKDLQNEIEKYQGGFATSAEEAGLFKQFWLLVKRHPVESIAAIVIPSAILVTMSYFIARMAYFTGQHGPVYPEGSVVQINTGGTVWNLKIRTFKMPGHMEPATERMDIKAARCTQNLWSQSFDGSDKSHAVIKFLHIEDLPEELKERLKVRLAADIPAFPDPYRSTVLTNGQQFTLPKLRKLERNFFLVAVGWETQELLKLAPEATIELRLVPNER